MEVDGARAGRGTMVHWKVVAEDAMMARTGEKCVLQGWGECCMEGVEMAGGGVLWGGEQK
jgi:hypothetical protein